MSGHEIGDGARFGVGIRVISPAVLLEVMARGI